MKHLSMYSSGFCSTSSRTVCLLVIVLVFGIRNLTPTSRLFTIVLCWASDLYDDHVRHAACIQPCCISSIMQQSSTHVEYLAARYDQFGVHASLVASWCRKSCANAGSIHCVAAGDPTLSSLVLKL